MIRTHHPAPAGQHLHIAYLASDDFNLYAVNMKNGKLNAIYKKFHGVDIPVEQLLKAGN